MVNIITAISDSRVSLRQCHNSSGPSSITTAVIPKTNGRVVPPGDESIPNGAGLSLASTADGISVGDSDGPGVGVSDGPGVGVRDGPGVGVSDGPGVGVNDGAVVGAEL